MTTTDGSADTYSVRAVSRAISLLKAFADAEELTLSELAQRVGIAKPTVFRIASTLEQHGLLARGNRGAYHLGFELLAIARLVLDRSIVRVARPFMDELFRAYGHSVNLAVLDGGEMLFVEVIEARHAFRMAGSVGRREPVHA